MPLQSVAEVHNSFVFCWLLAILAG
jgi:hypothetical protein